MIVAGVPEKDIDSYDNWVIKSGMSEELETPEEEQSRLYKEEIAAAHRNAEKWFGKPKIKNGG